MNLKLAETKEELLQVLELQHQNHLESIYLETQQSKGFVTVRHTFDLLNQMNQMAPQIIAIENGNVVGYALVMLKEFKEMIPVLIPMFNSFEHIFYHKKKLNEFHYYVMGQVCIKESHRGKGLFKELYEKHQECYAKKFELCITEVSTSNIPSMKAHKKVGFKIVHTYRDDSEVWNVLVWDWNYYCFYFIT